jgi:hypothetical protein
MAGFIPLFSLLSIQELQALDAKELEILRDAIRKEIATSQEIQAILRAKALEVYNQLRPPATGT